MFWLLKLAHVSLVALSFGLFVLRGGAALLAQKPLTGRRWRVLPQAVDTLLLVCGVGLAVWLRLDPLHSTWLGAKLLWILAYIGLGLAAFRLPGPRGLRLVLFAAACLTFGFIVSIAFWHDPRGIFTSIAMPSVSAGTP